MSSLSAPFPDYIQYTFKVVFPSSCFTLACFTISHFLKLFISFQDIIFSSLKFSASLLPHFSVASVLRHRTTLFAPILSHSQSYLFGSRTISLHVPTFSSSLITVVTNSFYHAHILCQFEASVFENLLLSANLLQFYLLLHRSAFP